MLMQKIKIILAILVVALSVFWMPRMALADCANPSSTKEAVKCGGNKAAGQSNKDPNSLDIVIKRILNIFSTVVGLAAVIMIIYGGFRYITSGGDSTKVGSAKNTLIYAVIGLAIAALAQVIARFVLNEVTKP